MEVLEGVGAESRLYDAARLLSTLWVQVRPSLVAVNFGFHWMGVT